MEKKPIILGGTVHVAPINKDWLIFPKVDGLEYFYEPKPNSVAEINLNWENTNGPKIPTYKINSDGLNQTTNFSVEKPKNVSRIIILGDSYTFGFNVNTEDNYPSQLQNLLDENCMNKFQILNLGVEGYDIQYAVERYKVRGRKYDPDIVLWLVVDDDMNRLDEFVEPKFTNYYLQELQNGNNDANTKEGKFYVPWIKAKEEIQKKLGQEAVLGMQKSFLNELNQYFSKKLLISIFPRTGAKHKKILKDFVSSRPNSYFNDKLIEPVDKGKLPDGHPSPLGHKQIAQSIFDYLKTNKIVQCNK